MLEGALAAGVAQGGGDALIAGVVPTPPPRSSSAAWASISRLSSPHPTTPGMTTASSSSAATAPSSPTSPRSGSRRRSAPTCGRRRPSARSACFTARPTTTCASSRAPSAARLDGLKVVLDCANGSTHFAGPEIFRRLGARPESCSPSPTGGTSTRAVARPIPRRSPSVSSSSGADIGFAFDGDGDRVLAVDASRASARRR